VGRDIKEIEKEGMDITEKLGNGVKYVGPQMENGKLAFHLSEDDRAVTGTSFTGMTFEEAKESFIQKRKVFNAPPPLNL